MFDVKIEFKGAEKILCDRGLDEGGEVQRFFSSEVMRVSNPYVPFRNGILQALAWLSDENDAIIYGASYARYHWHGKLMVDPKTQKGAFYNPQTGRFWSRPNVQKELTDRDMEYNEAPMRGPRWCERAWIDHGDAVIESTQKTMEEVASKRDNN